MPHASIAAPAARRPLALTLLVLALLAAAPRGIAVPVAPDRAQDLMDRFVAEHAAEDWSAARATAGEYLELRPDDPLMLYNLACVHARDGRPNDAARTLAKAVDAGFRQFGEMQLDSDLDSIRDHPIYRAIVEASTKARSRPRVHREVAALERFRTQFGERRYQYDRDPVRGLDYASNLSPETFAEMRGMVEWQTDHLADTLFDGLPGYRVLIAVPEPEHAHELLRSDHSIGGIYDHGQRMLVTRDIGASLRHELLHVLHYGHMERLGQQHPLWIQEGLASLYEEYEIDDQGAIRFLPNERHTIIRNRVKIGGTMDWRRMVKLSDAHFMRIATQLYPQVRSIFEFLAATDRLVPWYRAYIDSYHQDPSGLLAFEQVLGRDLEDVQRRWRTWVLDQPAVDYRVDRGDASLGIEVDTLPTISDGVVVRGFTDWSPARSAGMRIGDVVVSIDGRGTRTPMELSVALGGKRVGQNVLVRVRRGESHHTLRVALRAKR